MGAALPHNKLCNLEDFQDPRLRGLIRNVFSHDVARFGSDFPRGREYRKYWEVAMAVGALLDLGVLRTDAEVLGVGAGNEPTVFWLTNLVRRVHATDLYLASGEWEASASPGMLTDPGQFWPGPWNPRRLVVQHMDALDLRYEDASFDAIFSSSSIEHFGSQEAVRRAAAEMCRVLKPGGILTLATEYRLEGPSLRLPGTLLFDAHGIQECIVGGLPWSLVAPLDRYVSPATRSSEQDLERAVEEVQARVAEDGGLFYHHLEWSRYPHIVLRAGDAVFTSVHLALRKDASAAR